MQYIHILSLERGYVHSIGGHHSLPFVSFHFNTESLNIKVIMNVRRPYTKRIYL
jgi:hypothetical protein